MTQTIDKNKHGHGKKYLEAQKLVDPEKLYQPQEAISLLKKLNYVKFDPTVEIHMRLGVDPRRGDRRRHSVAGDQRRRWRRPHPENPAGPGYCGGPTR